MTRRLRLFAGRYLIALVVGLAALLAQCLLGGWAGFRVIGVFYPATFLTAWFFGLGPAMVVVGVCIVSALTGMGEPDVGFRLTLFVSTSVLTAWIVNRGRVAVRDLAESRGHLGSAQARLERASKATKLGIWYCNLPFGVLNWNRETKTHFWLPEDAHVTIDLFYERIHPEDREPTRVAIDRSIEGREPYDIIYRTVNPADPTQFKYIRAIGWTDWDAAGKPIRFDGITLDNTVIETINRVGASLTGELDLKRLVQTVTDGATRVSGAEYGSFFYTVPDEKGDSYMLYTLSGATEEQFAGFPMPRKTEIFGPTFGGEGVVRSDDITRDPRYGKNAPYAGMPPGHVPVASYLAVPVISRTGEVLGGLFFGHSRVGVFTEREERLVVSLASQAAVAMDNARLFDKANRAIRARDEFLSISSHELRTPLTPLKMQLQVLARHLNRGTISTIPEESLRRMIETSEKQVLRLTALIEDLLDVSRISSGRLTLNYEALDLVEVAREVVERYRPQLDSAGCPVSFVASPSLPAELDRLRFEQILVNLLTNALRYSAGKPVEVRLSEEAGMAILKVCDQGIGIAPEDQKRIFARFERGLSSEHFGGLGLGLFIVNQIAGAHGGRVEVESELGRGSTFTVRLPVRKNA